MHSRIFQVSTKPIHKEDYIDESRYYDHWFLSSVADYVNENTDRENDIGWLKACNQDNGLSFGADDCGEYLVIEDKIKYFMLKFETFQKILQELSTLTVDGFANGECNMQMYRLKAAYDEEFGFYIDGDETNMMTFDDFVRYTDTGIKHYIGATIDYHF